jgi:hypothetical protein
MKYSKRPTMFCCRLNRIQLPPHSLNFYLPYFCLSLSSLCVTGRACVAVLAYERERVEPNKTTAKKRGYLLYQFLSMYPYLGIGLS